MAIITDPAQPASVAPGLAKPVPSYMRSTKTSSQKTGPTRGSDKTLKPKDLNLMQVIRNGFQHLKTVAVTKLPGVKQNEPAKSKALVVVNVCP